MSKESKKVLPKVRVTAYVEKGLLALLGVEPNTEGVGGALRAYGALMSAETLYLDSILTPDDWRFLALALREMADWGGVVSGTLGESFHAELSVAAAKDATLRRVWKVDPQGNYDLLRAAARKLTELQIRAVLVAVAYYWTLDAEPAADDRWWRPGHRVRRALRKAASDAGGESGAAQDLP